MYLFLIQAITDNTGHLDTDESAHCIKVLRKKAGDTIHCIDGKGNYYECTIETVSKNGVSLYIHHKIAKYGEKNTGKITLAAAPLKQKDRYEWLIEKAVELGVDEITPITTKHTISGNIKPERLQNIIVSATKQCKRGRFPVLNPVISFENSLPQSANAALKLIAYCEAENHINTLHQEILEASSLVLLIGPEGDFTPEEVAQAQKQGFHSVSLGKSRLRTETAAIFGLSVLKMIKGY